MSTYEHSLNKDIPIGDFYDPKWVPLSHMFKHIEIIGRSGKGKTTLVEQLILGLLERTDAGILHLDPTGHGYRSLIGWAAEKRIKRRIYPVDPDTVYPNYDPLRLAKTDPETFIAALFSAMSLINGADDQRARQMRRWVNNTLEALMDIGSTLAWAFDWVDDLDNYRTNNLRNIKDPRLAAKWKNVTATKMGPAAGWFDIFDRKVLKQMFGRPGFDWQQVYNEQAIVAVNLGAKKLSGEITLQKAVAGLYITGLLATAQFTEPHKLWYVIIEDATNHTPSHVKPILTMFRHFNLWLVLVHHGRIPDLPEAHDGCETKFLFGKLPSEFHETETTGGDFTHRRTTTHKSEDGSTRETVSENLNPKFTRELTKMSQHQCLHVFDDERYQVIDIKKSPPVNEALIPKFLERYNHYDYPWYDQREPFVSQKSSAPSGATDQKSGRQSARGTRPG